MEGSSRKCRTCSEGLNLEDGSRFLLKCSKCSTSYHNTCHIPVVGEVALREMFRISAQHRQRNIRGGEGSIEGWVCSECRMVRPPVVYELSSSESDNDEIQIVESKSATGTNFSSVGVAQSEHAPHATHDVKPLILAANQPGLNANAGYLRTLFPLQRSYQPPEVFSHNLATSALSQWIDAIPSPNPTPRPRKQTVYAHHDATSPSKTALLLGSAGKWTTWTNTQ